MERLSTCICIYKNAAVGRQQRAIREKSNSLQSQYLERREEEEKGKEGGVAKRSERKLGY